MIDYLLHAGLFDPDSVSVAWQVGDGMRERRARFRRGKEETETALVKRKK